MVHIIATLLEYLIGFIFRRQILQMAGKDLGKDAFTTTKWIRPVRDLKPVLIQVAKPKSDPSGENEVTIINECYKEQNEITVNNNKYEIYGTMGVNPDGTIFAASAPPNSDPKYKFTQYQFPSDDRQEIEPNRILLESQSLPSHFVHWDSNLMEVKCVTKSYDEADGLSIDIKGSDKQFVWVVPLENNTKFALKTFDNPYYLVFGQDRRPLLRKGDKSDLPENSKFMLYRY